MTRDEKIQATWWLHAMGLSYQRIAPLLGYASYSSAWKLLHPEETARRDAAQNARRGPAKRAWEREHDRRPCPCGAPRGVGAHRERPDGLCGDCYDEVRAVGAAMRRERIAVMWNAGESAAAIAAALDTTTNVIGSDLTRMRRDGWDVPRRRKGWTDQAGRVAV